MNNNSLQYHCLFSVLIYFISLTGCSPDKYFTDPHGNKYRTVTIDDQKWMAENLRFNVGDGFFCYENDPTQCVELGGLYTWSAALNASERITGWHLPSKQEW